MTSEPILTVSHLIYARRGRTLFNDLSFELLSSEALIISGPNGSGKTTLLRSIAGIPETPPQIIKRQGVKQSYVAHTNALKGHLTVLQSLMNQTDATQDAIHHVLSKLNILELTNRLIETLSAGQRRQVALARLPLSDAQLWIVDEPTTHLDEKATLRFWDIVRAHQLSGGAAVISSHNLVPLSDSRILKLHG